MKRNLPLTSASRRLNARWRIALPLAVLLASGALLRAGAPPNPAVELTYSEGTGISTTNTGYLAGSAGLAPGTTTNGYPTFTNNVPAGTYVPAGNASALNMGIVDTTGGGRTVDLATDYGPGGTPGSFIGGMTICGWLNSRDNRVGSGGNRVAFALEGPNGLGFDVMQRGGGAMGFNVNQYNDGGPASSLQMITENAGANPSNWVFFAVTYNPGLGSGQVKFYFGRPDKLAGLDVARTYAPSPTNEIEYTGKLTVGNFSSAEGVYSATGTGSRTYRGLMDQLRIYTNILSIDEIQQAQLESSTVPAVAATILRHPASVTMTASPFRTATFRVDANGSGLVTYQWLTNGVAMVDATNTSLTLPADTTAYNGIVLSVLVDNALTTDPGVLSSNATLTINNAPTPSGTMLTSADVLFNGTQVFNAWRENAQVNWGLGGSGGVTTAAGRRSFMVFTLGTNPVSSAKFKIWNYWGGPSVNGQGRLAEATTRIYGTLTNTPLTITEPPPGSNTTIPGFEPLNNANFFAIAPDQLVGPSIGWYEFDITGWYNACLGQTTTIMLRASATSGFDFPLYEDREGTAFAAPSAGGTAADTGPRLEVFLPPPSFKNVSAVGGNLLMSGNNGTPGANYVLLSSPDIALPLGSWTRVVTNQFDAAGNFSETQPISAGAAQRFYRLLVP